MDNISSAFLMNPIEEINPRKDSTFALMLEAQRQGWQNFYLTKNDIFYKNNIVYGIVKEIKVQDNTNNYFNLSAPKIIEIHKLNTLFLRLEPPFDQHFLYITQLLEIAGKQGVNIINSPTAVRKFNEKIFPLNFSEFIPKTIISNNKVEIEKFINTYKHVILKPLDGMGGQSIFNLHINDINKNVIIETMLANNNMIIAQEYLQEIMSGDKRIIMINGEAIPYGIARIPAKNDYRGNLAAGAKSVLFKLTNTELIICQKISNTLKQNNLHLVGVDVIGNKVTEINITCPTCIREIERETDINICQQLFNNLF